MAKIDLILDLEDDLGPVQATLGAKGRGPTDPLKRNPTVSAPSIAITSVPVAITVSYAHVHCLACGDDTQQMLGLFLESKLSNGVRVLQRKSLRELGPYANLPRKLDVAPAVAVEICPTCFGGDRTFRGAMAAAQAQGELPFDVENTIAATLATELELTINLSEETQE